MSYSDRPQSILFLADGDLPDKRISVRLAGGLREQHIAHDLAALERRARLIIEQHKLGDWPADPAPQMPRGFEGS